MLSIIVGVLIALAVDEWNEDRENMGRANTALVNIRSEVQKNLSILESLHPRNIEAYNVVLSEETTDDSSQIVPGLQLQDVAWQTLMRTGISVHVDYEDLYEIAELYSIQMVYKAFANSLIEQIMATRSMTIISGEPVDEGEIIRSSVELLALMISVEEDLITLMSEYLERAQ